MKNGFVRLVRGLRRSPIARLAAATVAFLTICGACVGCVMPGNMRTPEAQERADAFQEKRTILRSIEGFWELDLQKGPDPVREWRPYYGSY